MSVFAIAIALALDFTFGDVDSEWHPVSILGRLIVFLESHCRLLPVSSKTQGYVFLALNILLFIVPIAVISFVGSFLGYAKVFVNGFLIYFALGGTCLARRVGEVILSLDRGAMGESKEKLRMLVSRDVDAMGETEIASSAIETLSENFSDSAVATLLYAALGGPVLAWIHRISNTLDAMVGYKTEKYMDFGYASAKFDDILNFIPSRVSAFIIALASKSADGDFTETLRCALAYGRTLPSPNSGYPIAAFAGALGVKLCGPTKYFGEVKDKPYVGEGPRPHISDLVRSMTLYWTSYALASVLSVLLALVWR